MFQVNVPFTEDTNIQCMQNTSSEIDYFVSVGSTTRIEEMLENHPVCILYSASIKYFEYLYSSFLLHTLIIFVVDVSWRH